MHQHWIQRHPRPEPAQIRPSSLLIEPPGRLSATDDWHRFRRDLASLLPHYPNDPNLPLFLDAADTVIAWRNTVPPKGRFWAADRA